MINNLPCRAAFYPINNLILRVSHLVNGLYVDLCWTIYRCPVHCMIVLLKAVDGFTSFSNPVERPLYSCQPCLFNQFYHWDNVKISYQDSYWNMTQICSSCETNSSLVSKQKTCRTHKSHLLANDWMHLTFVFFSCLQKQVIFPSNPCKCDLVGHTLCV